MSACSQTGVDRYALALAAALRTPDAGADHADRIIRLRLELRRALVEQGWSPPDAVVDAMRRDELLLAESVGHSEHLARPTERLRRFRRLTR